tara:strand:+ start:1907 stop:2299 length:393 start_codon:yes stop_codon:yes gene_type:complete
MANHKGSEGVVKVGTATVAEVKDWSLSETAETIDDTIMGETARSRLSSLTSASGSISAFWDETDSAGQMAMTAGATISLNLYPEGTTSGDYYASLSAIITSFDTSAAMDGMVEATFAFESNGAVTWAAVT